MNYVLKERLLRNAIGTVGLAVLYCMFICCNNELQNHTLYDIGKNNQIDK